MARKAARDAAMRYVYQWALGGNADPEAFLSSLALKLSEKDYLFFEETMIGVVNHLPELDKLIEENCVGWKFDRLAKVDVAILRVALFEILYREDIPKGVSINEAVELAKVYGDGNSYAFVNGILGNVVRREGEALKRVEPVVTDLPKPEEIMAADEFHE